MLRLPITNNNVFYENSAALGVTDYDAKDWDDQQFDTFLEIVYDDDGNYVTYHQGDQEFEDPISEGEDQFLVRTWREERHAPQLTHSGHAKHAVDTVLAGRTHTHTHRARRTIAVRSIRRRIRSS